MKHLMNGMMICLTTLFFSIFPAFVFAQTQDALVKYKEAYAVFQQDLNNIEARLQSISSASIATETETKEKDSVSAKSTRMSKSDSIAIQGELVRIRQSRSLHAEKYQMLNGRAATEASNSSYLAEVKAHEQEMLDTLNAFTDTLVEYEMLQLKSRKGTAADTTVIRLGSSKIIIIDDGENKKNSYQYLREQDEKKVTPKKDKQIEMSTLGVSLGLNTFMYKYDLNLPLKYSDLDIKGMRSWNVNVRLVEAKVNMYKHRVNLLSGISVDWNNYRFINNTQFSARTDTLMMSRDTIQYRKNKFMTQNLMGHLMLQYETRPDKNGRTFDIGVGVFGGYLLNARMKQVSDQNGKVKMDDDYQLNPFRYGICARIGYGAFDFYVNYTLNNLFRENLGPQVQNLSFGINITAL